MQIHLVGGFLGSGKTTAIVGAARLLAARGMVVGVVTNHQGKHLVDTAFVQAEGFPAVEVTGGCFCCHYDDLVARLEQLRQEARPDVIFAESVGSCADLVATVVKPLLAYDAAFTPASFSVFADCRLLRRRLLGEELPFSDAVSYIFDQQIEEAGLLVVNKVDLLPRAALDELRQLASWRWPEKALMLHSALAHPGAATFADWLALIEAGKAPAPQPLQHMDYPRYGLAEARLSWLDMEIHLRVAAGEGRAALMRLLEGVLERLKARGGGIGHFKAIIRWEAGQVKASLTGLEDLRWREQIPAMSGEQVSLAINAHVELPPEELLALLRQALEACGAAYAIERADSFSPRFPNPTHRLV